MNLQLQVTTIPAPEDILARRADPMTSTWLVTPEKLAGALTSFVERTNKADIWKDRGSLVFVIQPVLEDGKPS